MFAKSNPTKGGRAKRGICNDLLIFESQNARGDVIGILDNSGNTVVKYSYDAYGNCSRDYSTNNDLADSNPIRYRSYYYDNETGLYYLNARYYSPEWRRFISPDDAAYLDPESVNGLNLYTYCNNDPVNHIDPTGHSIVGAILIGAAIGAGISFVFSLGSELYQNNWDFDKVNWNLVAVDTVFGAIDGALSVMGLSAPVSLLIQSVLAGAQTVISAAVSGNLHNLTAGQVVNAIVFSALMTGASSALSHYRKINTGYDTFKNHKIRDTMDNHLATVKSPKKRVMYQSKIDATFLDSRIATRNYIIFTSFSLTAGGVLGL